MLEGLGRLTEQPEETYREFSQKEKAIIQAARMKAEKIMLSRLDPNDFRDLYGDDAIDRDLKHVEQLRERMDSRQMGNPEIDSIATSLEACLLDQVNSGNVFGSGSEGRITAEFDDYVSGIDLIVEKKQGDRGAQHLGLALDATLSGNYVGKKIMSIKKEVEANFLPRIKYFRSEQAGIRGELLVPRFATGVDMRHTLEILQKWCSNDNLDGHPAVFVILKQVEEQAVVFADFASKCGHVKLSDRYKGIIKMVTERRTELRNETGTVFLPKDWQEDRVSTGIRTALSKETSY